MISEDGLQPNDFSYSDELVGKKYRFLLKYCRLKNEEKEYYFELERRENGSQLDITFSPAEMKIVGYDFDKSWSFVPSIFKNWLLWLKRELDAHRYLNDLSQWKETQWFLPRAFDSVDDVNNEPFDDPEADAIRSTIEEIKAKIDSNQEVLLERLDYIAHKVGTMGKIDWKNLAVGTLMSIVVEGIASKETVSMIFEFLKSTFTKALPPAI